MYLPAAAPSWDYLELRPSLLATVYCFALRRYLVLHCGVACGAGPPQLSPGFFLPGARCAVDRRASETRSAGPLLDTTFFGPSKGRRIELIAKKVNKQHQRRLNEDLHSFTILRCHDGGLLDLPADNVSSYTGTWIQSSFDGPPSQLNAIFSWRAIG